MTIQIDKNVPMPEARNATEYPFEGMEIGDSFFVSGKTSDQLTNAASHWRKKNGWGFSARNISEPKGARIWRTK